MSDFQTLLDQAWQAHQGGSVVAAERVYRELIARQPKHAAAHVYLGIAQFDQRQFEASVNSYRRAIELQPRFAIAWNNLGNSLRMLGELDEADRCFQKAIDQQPSYLSPRKNRGTLWVWAGEIERGLASYAEGLRMAPDDPELHRNLGVIYLLLERYDLGWAEYRWRWHFIGGGRPQHPQPLWQGEDLAGKTILIYPEQGLGDAIQFIRVATTLRSMGARTVVQCSSKLIPLFSSAPGIDVLVPEEIAPQMLGVGEIDFHASFIDVVDIRHGQSGQLATATSESGELGPYLKVSDSLRDYWRRQLDNWCPDRQRRRIGICWQGNPRHHADIYRSVPLSSFAPLARRDDLQLISLQHGFGTQQIAESGFAERILRLPETLDTSGGAFLDTAAIMTNLDVVITTDTSTAHLAGALGVPTWLILGKVPDWRWGQSGAETKWYPSLRLWRQSDVGCWSDVFDRIAKALDSAT